MIPRTIYSAVLAGAIAAASAGPAAAEAPAGPAVKWDAVDTAGRAVTVPDAQRAVVLLFVLAGQPQSADAVTSLRAALAGPEVGGARVVVVVNGADAAAQVKTLADEKVSWPVVVDADHAASGKLGVHAWPTTVVVGRDGARAGYVPGLPKAYAADVAAYVAFATGGTDRAGLEKRLAAHATVVDSPEQVVERHVQVARRLLQKGLAEQARAEAGLALKAEPTDPGAVVRLAELLVDVGDVATAGPLLDKLGPTTAKPAVKLLRARLLIAAGKWDEARALLVETLRLNPDPAEAYYHLGLVYEHDNDPARAAASFRKAYETSPAVRARHVDAAADK